MMERTREEWLAAIEESTRNGVFDVLSSMPADAFDKEVCLAAVRKNCWAIDYVPESMRDYDVCLAAAESPVSEDLLDAVEYEDGSMRTILDFIPPGLLDRRICEAAVRNSASFNMMYTLALVPEDLRDIVVLAARNGG